MPEPGRVPAEDGSVLAAVQAPAELAWERQPCPALGRSGRPAKRSRRAVEFCVNVRPEVEGEADIMATALELIRDLDGPRDSVHPNGPVVHGRRPQPRVPVVFSAPARGGPVVRHREFPPLRVSQPQERSASGRLPLPVNLDRVVPDRRTGSTFATQAHRGSSTSRGRREFPRRRTGPPPTARRRVRARRWTGSRGARRRSGTIARESRRHPFGGS